MEQLTLSYDPEADHHAEAARLRQELEDFLRPRRPIVEFPKLIADVPIEVVQKLKAQHPISTMPALSRLHNSFDVVVSSPEAEAMARQ